MQKSTKILLLVAVASAIVLFGWYVGTQRKTTRSAQPTEQELALIQQKTPIKIGFLHPMTGDAKHYGEAMHNTAQLAIDRVNAEGGVGGRLLELVIEDGKCNERDAAAAMRRLVDMDGVSVVLGGFCSGESLAAIPVAADGGVALFSSGSSSPDLTGKSPYFMRNYPSDALQGSVLADEALKRGWKKVAVIQEQLDYPAGILVAFMEKFEQGGGTIIKEEFSTTTTDFNLMLTRVRAEKPDALFIDSQTSASGERALKQVTELKWKIPLLITESFAGDAATVEANKSALEGALAAEFTVDEKNEKFEHLVSSYKERYGADLPFPPYAQSEYDAVFMVRDALVAVGEDGEKIAEYLRSTLDWQGASGSITIGGDGDRVGGYALVVVKDGKVQIVPR
ncbi:MAG: ABC transporter substrate-binding protein [Candidatus Uhrbacteria bacterium]|nr:ABC transporter substrate-binding protein [Candidatus Uhrbacteria bacterium]